MWQVMAFSWQQATTMSTGIHAEFIRHGVDAVTIETYMQPRGVSVANGLGESSVGVGYALFSTASESTQQIIFC